MELRQAAPGFPIATTDHPADETVCLCQCAVPGLRIPRRFDRAGDGGHDLGNEERTVRAGAHRHPIRIRLGSIRDSQGRIARYRHPEINRTVEPCTHFQCRSRPMKLDVVPLEMGASQISHRRRWRRRAVRRNLPQPREMSLPARRVLQDGGPQGAILCDHRPAATTGRHTVPGLDRVHELHVAAPGRTLQRRDDRPRRLRDLGTGPDPVRVLPRPRPRRLHLTQLDEHPTAVGLQGQHRIRDPYDGDVPRRPAKVPRGQAPPRPLTVGVVRRVDRRLSVRTGLIMIGLSGHGLCDPIAIRRRIQAGIPKGANGPARRLHPRNHVVVSGIEQDPIDRGQTADLGSMKDRQRITEHHHSHLRTTKRFLPGRQMFGHQLASGV